MRRDYEQFSQLLYGAASHAFARFIDPKNEAKGDWLDEPPLKMCRELQKEALEVHQAYRDKEGLHRELEELGDVVLRAMMRMNQIHVQLEKEAQDEQSEFKSELLRR